MTESVFFVLKTDRIEKAFGGHFVVFGLGHYLGGKDVVP